MTGTEGPQGAGDQLSAFRKHPRWTVADLGVLLGQRAPQGDEGAGTATMIVPVGALARQPGQQPSLKIMLAGEANVVPSGRIVGHQRLPQGALLGKVSSNLDEIYSTSVFLGHGSSFDVQE
jgi:hypothetical protein